MYLYGLILARNARRVPSDIPGIDGATVRLLPLDALAAVVSDRDSGRGDLHALRAHDRVMQTIVRSGITATAVRFGQTFADDAELRRHLGSYAELGAALEQLDGQVEMRLLMTLPDDEGREIKATAPGTAYLESLRASTRTAGLSLRAALGPVVRAERVEDLPRANGVAFAHLIRRDDEPEYRDAVRAHPSLAEAAIVGPLPLSAFAEGE